MQVRQLVDRITSLKTQLLIEEGALRSAEQSFVSIGAMVDELSRDGTLLSQVDMALTELSGKLLNQSTGSIDKMVTLGLQFVFSDMQLEFRTSVEKYRGKSSVKFSLFQNGKEAPIMDSYGGGVIAVTGVLLRVVTIMALRARRFLLLDETLAHVSNQYTANVSALLNKLCSDLEFDILLVTHNPEFAEYAAHHFKAEGTVDGTIFKKL